MNNINYYHNDESIGYKPIRLPCKMLRIAVSLFFGCLFIMSAGSFALSQEKITGDNTAEAVKKSPPSHPTSTKELANLTDKAKLSIPDLTVQTQDNQVRKFYTDLVKGKLVIINFIYTSCKAICPLSGEHFAKLQEVLGDRLGKDVFLVSVTTDPETDTPQKLKQWGERFKPKEGWTLVTGEQSDMTALLKALTGEGPRKDFHTPLVLLVNDNNGAWIVTYSLDSPTNVLGTLERLSNQSKTGKH